MNLMMILMTMEKIQDLRKSKNERRSKMFKMKMIN